MKEQILIGIAEDHDIVRQGFVALLKGNRRIKVVLEANNGRELLTKLKSKKVDVVLLDIEMPVLNGKEVVEVLKKKFPKVKIIVISAFFKDAYVIEFFKKGINAFLAKNTQIGELIEAIESVSNKGSYYNDEVSEILAREVSGHKTNILADGTKHSFSQTELSIIRLICQSKTSKEIAEILKLGIRTVEWHRGQILNKAGAKNTSALMLFAINNKLIEIH